MKITQYYTILYNVQKLTSGAFKYKKPSPEVVAYGARMQTSDPMPRIN
jgi:hypothetical protein